MRGSKSKSDLPGKADDFVKGDGLSKATKAR